MDIKSLKDVDTLKKQAASIWKDFLEETKNLKKVDAKVFKEAFNKYFVEYLKNQYVNFNGRVSRRDFWMFALFAFLIGSIFSLLLPFLSTVYTLAILIPCIGIGCRRLHDLDLPSYWVVSALIIVGFFLFALPGDKKANQYGEIVK